jgi:hypothetical protein
MDGTLYYYVLKKYKGMLIKKHKSNTHLFFVPVEPNKYMYLSLIGVMEDEENTYAAQLLVRLPEDILDDTIAGEKEYFGDRFVEVEKLECKSSNQSPGKYIITPKKIGFNILSNLEINYQVEYSTIDRRIYLVKGELNLVTGEINEQNIKMVATKQAAFMGDKQRFKEQKNIIKLGRFK